MRWTDCRIVAFDTETTGLRPFDGDRVIEFGAVELTVTPDMRVTDVQRHDFLINPGMPIPRDATKVSGIGDDAVADEPPFEKRAGQVRRLLADAILVAHNLAFDLGFIRAELARCDHWWPRTLAEVDTLPLAQARLPELKNYKLGTLCKAMEVDLVEAHRASNDAEACGRAFVELCRRQGAPDSLEELVVWADAVSQPPPTGHLAVGDKGVAEFLGGPFQGQTIEQHPDYLQWMTMALERTDGGWTHRFPDELREWGRRWLRARGAARTRASSKGGSSQDWNLDPAPWRQARAIRPEAP
ncbi:MAG: 3'-5' exonuclease [Alphaproteobacteria bacterium]|nr:3'-5' exonuclease [Alphaproteobacteria bacterium]